MLKKIDSASVADRGERDDYHAAGAGIAPTVTNYDPRHKNLPSVISESEILAGHHRRECHRLLLFWNRLVKSGAYRRIVVAGMPYYVAVSSV